MVNRTKTNLANQEELRKIEAELLAENLAKLAELNKVNKTQKSPKTNLANQEELRKIEAELLAENLANQEELRKREAEKETKTEPVKPPETETKTETKTETEQEKPPETKSEKDSEKDSTSNDSSSSSAASSSASEDDEKKDEEQEPEKDSTSNDSSSSSAASSSASEDDEKKDSEEQIRKFKIVLSKIQKKSSFKSLTHTEVLSIFKEADRKQYYSNAKNKLPHRHGKSRDDEKAKLMRRFSVAFQAACKESKLNFSNNTKNIINRNGMRAKSVITFLKKHKASKITKLMRDVGWKK